MIPRIQRSNSRAITLSKGSAPAGDCHPKGVRPSVRTCLKLPSGELIGFSHDLPVVRRIGGSLNPGAPSHTSGDLQQRGVTEVNITARSVETQCFAKSSTRNPSCAEDIPSNPMTGGIIYRRPAPFVKIVSCYQTTRRSGSRSGYWGRCRGLCRHGKSINFVAGGKIDPTARDDANVPLTCIGHQLVRPTAGVNHRASIAIIAVQALVSVSGTDHPHNRIICPISSCDPRRPLAGLTDAPSRDDGWRICCSNFVSRNRAATIAKNKVFSVASAITGSGLTSDSYTHVRGC